MSPSPYTPLPRTGDFIRLLRLAPGDQGDDLAGDIIIHDLEVAQPDYLAISYVCGDDDRSRYHINASGSKLGIYKNADEVLRRFRGQYDTSYVWIDVVCIDQDNMLEKSREVGLIHKVYQKAKRTMIWVGPADAGTTIAIQYMKSLDAAKCMEEYLTKVMDERVEITHKSNIFDALKGHKQKESIINCCAEFLLRPWFSRIWTQQESALSSKPVIVCGMEEMPWDQVFALSWLYLNELVAWPVWFLPDHNTKVILERSVTFVLTIQRFRIQKRLAEVNEAPSHTELGLRDAMAGALGLGCSDPRDRIYAMRNIAADAGKYLSEPDYITPWEDVYTNFTAQMVTHMYGSLVYNPILRWSGVCQQGENLVYLPGLLIGGVLTVTISKKQKLLLAKALHAANQPRKSLRHSLRITSVMQDTITFLGKTLQKKWALEDIETLYQDILDLDQKSRDYIGGPAGPTYITSEQALEVYDAALIANTDDDRSIASPSYIQEAQKWRAWLASGAKFENNEVPEYHLAIDARDTFRTKQFCVSDNGYFCLVPSITELTDIIAIVEGERLPVVVRPFREYYIYLGQCYIHGMMAGQAGIWIEEFRVRYDNASGTAVIARPDGDVRRNGLKEDAGEYVRILGTLGKRPIELI